MTTKKLCFGLRKSKSEPHEHVVSFNYEKVDMPIKFSLNEHVKQVYDQANMNSCSANATANLLSMSDKHNKLKCMPVDYICISVQDGLTTTISYQ